MKFLQLVALLATALTAAAGDMAGTWKVNYAGPPKTGPKSVGSILVDLTIEGNRVTGAVQIGSWPGAAPISDGKLEGERLNFTATGHLDSSTGIPTCQLDVTVQGDEMIVLLRAIKNEKGLGGGVTYEYRGKRTVLAEKILKSRAATAR